MNNTEPIEILDNLDEQFVEFWHSDEIRPFLKIAVDKLVFYYDYVECYSRDYSEPIAIIKEYDWYRYDEQ